MQVMTKAFLTYFYHYISNPKSCRTIFIIMWLTRTQPSQTGPIARSPAGHQNTCVTEKSSKCDKSRIRQGRITVLCTGLLINIYLPTKILVDTSQGGESRRSLPKQTRWRMQPKKWGFPCFLWNSCYKHVY
jgi:hypothetical protein